MNHQERALINQAVVSRLLGLKYMYQKAEADARLEREAQLAKDWAEWHGLDAESRAFVLDFLNQTTHH